MSKTSTSTTIAPSHEAMEQVRAMALEAATQDGWMTPEADEIVYDDRKAESRTDYGQFVGYHREGWEQTNHFTHYYYDQIKLIANEEALPHGIGPELSADGQTWLGGPQNWEKYHYGLVEPMVEEFWETWEQAVKLYAKWEKSVEHWNIDTYNLFTGIYWPGMKR